MWPGAALDGHVGFMFFRIGPLDGEKMISTRKPFAACVQYMRVGAALSLFCVVRPANAGGYVLSINGPATVTPGEFFEIIVALSGEADRVYDSLIFDVRVTGPRSLIYNGYLLDPVAFQTGGGDDFSIPKGAIDTGILTPPRLLGVAYFLAVTRSGQTFGAGDLVTLDLTMPTEAQFGEVFAITTLCDGFIFDADGCFWDPFGESRIDDGPPLRLTVVPEPFTLTFLVLGAMLINRRNVVGWPASFRRRGKR